MLVLSRKLGEEIIIDGNIRVKVVSVRNGRVRLAIDAPPEIPVNREEIEDRSMDRICTNGVELIGASI